jgi:16S rRNA (guanine527-N7)-methyltransferase
VAAGLRALGLDVPAGTAERLCAYAERVLEGTRRMNLVGYDTWDAMLVEGLLDSAALFARLRPTGRVVDVGSGAGLPGFVWAVLAEEGLAMTLLDATRKKVAFVAGTARALGVRCVTVWGRAEELAHGELREGFDGAVARALAPGPVALELTAPFVRVGGWVALAKGPTEAAASVEGMAQRLGLALASDEPYERPGGGVRRLWLFRKGAPTPGEYPRRGPRLRRRPVE